ncbi:MAG: S-methyl-5'-thioadenosine phosphorylase [Candidatus Bathyarchaeota archaeon]|nr:S-methyl-5'-thioadenosine phosphorylase [Candidatus Bathyarchaeota archaeon]
MRSKVPLKTEVAIISGIGLESLLDGAKRIRVGTPYGLPPPLSVGEIQGRSVVFLPRHGYEHSVPPHRINYRANIYALHQIGVERIIATNAVGAINLDFKPHDLVVPHDLADFTRQRPLTFYNEAPIMHVDFSEPYCPEVREALIKKAEETVPTVWNRAVYVCTEGPRYETPAEIRMFRMLGCDVVGMTGVPEAALARELGMCYATLCFVSNLAAGRVKMLSSKEIAKSSRLVSPKIRKILMEAITYLPKARHCQCAASVKESETGDYEDC